MKNSNLQKFAWVFFALALATTTLSAQGWRNGNRFYQNQNGNCLNSISGLTEKQEKQILEMEEKHHGSMAELRENRRAATDWEKKNKIREEMLKKVDAHRNAVKKVLTSEQQKQYDQLHGFGNNGYRNFANRGYGNRNFRGHGNYACNQNFAQGNRGGRGFAGRNGYRGNGRFCAANSRSGFGNGNGNFRGRGANFRNGNGQGYGNGRGVGYGNGANFRGRNNAGFGRGYGNGRYWQNSCSGSHNVSDEGFEVIEEKEFEEK